MDRREKPVLCLQEYLLISKTEGAWSNGRIKEKRRDMKNAHTKKNNKPAFGLGKPAQWVLLIGSVILLGVVLWGVQNGTFELRQQAARRNWPTAQSASITCYNSDRTLKPDCTSCTIATCKKQQRVSGNWLPFSGNKICLSAETKTGVCVDGTCVTDGSAGETCPNAQEDSLEWNPDGKRGF